MKQNAEGVSEAGVGVRKPVVAGWAKEKRVKVERERSDRTLTRFPKRTGGAGGRRRRLESTRGSPGSEADRTRGHGEEWAERRRRRPEAVAGWAKQKRGQGGEGVKRPDLDAVFRSEQVGAGGRCWRRESKEITRSDKTADVISSEKHGSRRLQLQNSWQPELIRIRTSSRAWLRTCSMSK